MFVSFVYLFLSFFILLGCWSSLSAGVVHQTHRNSCPFGLEGGNPEEKTSFLACDFHTNTIPPNWLYYICFLISHFSPLATYNGGVSPGATAICVRTAPVQSGLHLEFQFPHKNCSFFSLISLVAKNWFQNKFIKVKKVAVLL